MYSIHNVNYRF